MAKPQAQAPAPAAPAVKTESKGKRTVTVACNFPSGIVLQLCVKEDWIEEGLNGSRPRVRYTKTGEKYVVRGTSLAQDSVPMPKGMKRPTLEGGYALTPGIPADFWAEWLAQNKDNPIVVNKTIFASDTRDAIEGLADDHKEFRSGFEPLVPDTDPRIPKSTNPAVQDIATETRDAA